MNKGSSRRAYLCYKRKADKDDPELPLQEVVILYGEEQPGESSFALIQSWMNQVTLPWCTRPLLILVTLVQARASNGWTGHSASGAVRMARARPTWRTSGRRMRVRR